MSSYVVMFPADNEEAWATHTSDEQQAIFDIDFEFGQRLKARGGSVTGGHGLMPSVYARTLRRRSASEVDVGIGTYAGPGPEQLSGFFTATCPDYDELVQAAEVLTKAHPVVEIRIVREF